MARRITLAAFAVALAFSSAAVAQPFAGRGPGMMMMDPGIGRGFERMCTIGLQTLLPWPADRVAAELNFTDAQRAAYETYAAASASAVETLRGACPATAPATLPLRMEAMETRMGAMLMAITTIRPTLDAFYATLSDAQKARIDSRSDRWRFWHMRQAW